MGTDSRKDWYVARCREGGREGEREREGREGREGTGREGEGGREREREEGRGREGERERERGRERGGGEGGRERERKACNMTEYIMYGMYIVCILATHDCQMIMFVHVLQWRKEGSGPFYW